MTTDATPRSRDRRAQIVAAASDLFGRRGFEAVSMDDIVTAAGVSMGTVYRYFDGKEALVFAVTEANVGAVFGDASAPVPDLGQAVDMLIDEAANVAYGQLALQVWAKAVDSARLQELIAERQVQARHWLARAAERPPGGDPSPAALARAEVAICALCGMQMRLACGDSFNRERFRAALVQLLAG
jgi:TetR/AcrR family transcriptional regulator, transcriptional repressor of aconitase